MVPEGFARALDGFEAVVAGVPPGRWDLPTPCEGWCAADIAGHVIIALRTIQSNAIGSTVAVGAADLRSAAGPDPLETWRGARADMMAALDDAALVRMVELPWGSAMPLREFVERYPLEILVHTWDLAQATGQAVQADPDVVRDALDTARQFAPAGRAAGMIGPERAVSEHADDLTRLLALFGRSVTGEQLQSH